MCSSQNIIGGWNGQGIWHAWEDITCIYTLARKHEGDTLLDRHRFSWNCNIKSDRKEIRVVKNRSSDKKFVKCRKWPNCLSNYQLPKKDIASWSWLIRSVGLFYIELPLEHCDVIHWWRNHVACCVVFFFRSKL